MIRIAEINHTDDKVHEVSLCISDVDTETRETMIRNRTLSQALSAAEEALAASNAKFRRRWKAMEQMKDLEGASTEELNRLWREVKSHE